MRGRARRASDGATDVCCWRLRVRQILQKSVSQTVIKALLLSSGCIFGRLDTFQTLSEGQITAFQGFLKSGVENIFQKIVHVHVVLAVD